MKIDRLLVLLLWRYFIVALVPWLPHPFSSSFVYQFPLCPHCHWKIHRWRMTIYLKVKIKRTYPIVYFAVLVDHWIKIKENETRDEYLDLAREVKNLLNMWVTRITLVTVTVGTISKGLVKWLKESEVGGRVEIIQTTIVEVGQNTKKNPRDLRWFAITQTPVKSNQLTTLMWKSLKIHRWRMTQSIWNF